jgi:hypothetical protein
MKKTGDKLTPNQKSCQNAKFQPELLNHQETVLLLEL